MIHASEAFRRASRGRSAIYAIAAAMAMAALAAAFFAFPASAAQSSVSSRIDFGATIFSPRLKADGLDLAGLKKALGSESRDIPSHAHLLSAYVSAASTGTQSLKESSDDIDRLLAHVLLRFDPQDSVTVFDRGYLLMLVANLGYQKYDGRTYALMSLCDMATLLQMEPLNPYYHLFYTVVYASLKDHDISEFKLFDPLEELKKSLSFEVTDPQFHYIVGSTFLAISQNSPDIHQLAYAEFMQAVKLAPRNNALKEKVFRNLIDLLAEYDQRKAQKPFWLEETAYLYLIEKNQDSAAAHNNLGYLYVMSNAKLDMALEHCRKAVSLDPDNAVFLDSLGCAYYKNRNIKKAVETLKKAYAINPNSKDVNEHLAEIFLQTNDNDEAIKHMEFIVSQDPANALACNNLGYVLCEAGKKLDEALRLCKSAVETEPGNAIYLDSLAWAYFKNGKTKESLETFAKAMKIDPSLGALYIHRGDVLFTEDRLQDAIADYSKGMQLDTQFPDAHANFAYLNSILILRERLAGASKKFPSVKETLANNVFSYDLYPLYYSKLFEPLGFPPEKNPRRITASAGAGPAAAGADAEKKTVAGEKSVELSLSDMKVTGELTIKSDTFGIEILSTTGGIELSPSEKMKIINDTKGVEIRGTSEVQATSEIKTK